MKLYLTGHNYRYAVEQILMVLFPGEKPEYPTAPPGPGERFCSSALECGAESVTAHATIGWDGVSAAGKSDCPLPLPEDGLERDRLLQRILKQAIYKSAVEI
ncbi:MAG: coproporphyrinogen dehydrogenase HemZ, partial [Clostridiales bacterium]|nr:coproporphyrinogen dehydrogenase HemZ [Clostridiales bacterium]